MVDCLKYLYQSLARSKKVVCILKSVRICIIQFTIVFTIVLAIFISLSSGCAKEPPPPPASPYPADMSAYVYMPTYIKLRLPMQSEIKDVMYPNRDKPSPDNRITWIVDISAKNKEYSLPMTGVPKHWAIIAGDAIYYADNNPELKATDNIYPLSVAPGKTSTFKLKFTLPATLNPSDATLAYMGQEPNSICSLSGGDVVYRYDWAAQIAVHYAATTPVTATPTSTQNNSCSICGHYLWNQSPDVSLDVNKNGTFRVFGQLPGQSGTGADGYWESYNGGWQRFSTYDLQGTVTKTLVEVQYRLRLFGVTYEAGLSYNKLYMGMNMGSELVTSDIWIKQ